MSVKIGNIDLGEFPLLLAPMEDVSDPPFRYVCKQNGADMMYTEFISSEGLIRDAAKSRQKLDIFEYERPIGIQIFGSDIEHMREATEIATQANPDLMDINFAELRASRRMNARLRRIFATPATLVTGDCNAMKFGEKLFSVGYEPAAFDDRIPGARPLKCVFPKDLPKGATSGPDKIVYYRTPEQDAQNAPMEVSGPSVIVIH